jgi:hypothetical protein
MNYVGHLSRASIDELSALLAALDLTETSDWL